MKFVTLRPDGKTIAQRGECPAADVNQQPVPPGGSVVLLDEDADFPDLNSEYSQAQRAFVPSLPNVKRSRADALKAGCYQYIQAGFSSSAKGSALIYDSAPIEQTNMVVSAIAGGMIACKANANGIFAPVAHTQAQARQVLADFVTFRDAALQKAATLGNQIRNANTVADVQAITWSPA